MENKTLYKNGYNRGMREIKFRGFCRLHRRWEYYSLGDLVCGATTNSNGEGDFIGEWWGQFTGLKDKNGKEIWEGDIVETIENHQEINEAGELIGDRAVTTRIPVTYQEGAFVWGENCPLMALHLYRYQIIGNIYENPELLAPQDGTPSQTL